MGIPVLVLGYSGSGKSASMRNFADNEITLVNVNGKQLPFRNQHTNILSTDNYNDIMAYMKSAKTKIIVIDDSQYLMVNEFMRRAKETGFQKFTDIAQHYWNLIKAVETLPADTVVYFLQHLDRDEGGREKAKTIGKLLDEKIAVEGMFTIVLKSLSQDGKYYFATQTDGNDTCKSPIGLFDQRYIDNDLKFVDEAVRAYYRFSEAEICEDCKNEILASKGIATSEIVRRTKERYGVQLCWNCAAGRAKNNVSEG